MNTGKKLVIVLAVLESLLALIGVVMACVLFRGGGSHIVRGFIMLLSAFSVSPLLWFVPVFRDFRKNPAIKLLVQFAIAFWFFIFAFFIGRSDADATPPDRGIPVVEVESIAEETTEPAAIEEITTEKPTTEEITTEKLNTQPATTEILVTEELTTEPPTEEPTPSPTQPPTERVTAPPVKPTGRYVLNTNTMKFHEPGCPSVDEIAPENYQEYEGTADEVTAMGYTACKRCHPY